MTQAESGLGFQTMLAPDNCALALIDFQRAMFQRVQSHDRTAIVQNVQVIAEAARIFGVPVVLSTVAKDTFSGPFMPKVTEQVFSRQAIIDRTSINAWLDPAFRAAVRATGRKRIVIAGLWTNACVNFLTLDLLREGFDVFVVADACGDMSPEAHDRAMRRMIQAGAIPLTALQVVFEFEQDWARADACDVGDAHPPGVGAVRHPGPVLQWALGDHAGEAARATVGTADQVLHPS